MNSIKVGDRLVGAGEQPLVIAEVAQAHDGSLGFAHSYIDAVADAGGHAIKFQTHIAAAESTPGEPWRVKFSRQDDTRYEYWQRMEFKAEHWRGLFEHAHERDLLFISSPFSVAAVELLLETGVDAFKIGSGETSNPTLMNAMAHSGKPVLISTGMSPWHEIEAAVELAAQLEMPHALFQCTSMYPTPTEKVGLNVLQEMMNRFDCPIGLSDHTATPYSSLAAVALGASLLEVHVVFHTGMFGPDVGASLTIEEFGRLLEGSQAIHTMRTHPVDKDAMADEMTHMRSLFNKSVALCESQPAGTVLQERMLTVKKPGTGIAARELHKLVGRRLIRTVSSGVLLAPEDLEGA